MAKKKTFKEDINPAMQFISAPTEEIAEEPAPAEPIAPSIAAPAASTTASKPKAPDGYKLNPLYIEKKSKRVQLLMQPSVYEKLKEKAKSKETSFNDFIHTILQEVAEEE